MEAAVLTTDALDGRLAAERCAAEPARRPGCMVALMATGRLCGCRALVGAGVPRSEFCTRHPTTLRHGRVLGGRVAAAACGGLQGANALSHAGLLARGENPPAPSVRARDAIIN
jgi:hypothetical protein